MISPHGGRLVDRIATGTEREQLLESAGKLPSITLNARETSDLEMLATGAMSPLEGFMVRADYDRVLSDMRLAHGQVWPLPVVLATKPGDDAEQYQPGFDVALHGQDGQLLGILHMADKWEIDREAEAQACLTTTDEAHPGVQYLNGLGSHYLGGRITVFSLPSHDKFNDYRLTPKETRVLFKHRGWRTVAAFQTRNPIHRAHEYLTKCALELCDGILIHPLVGETKSDDIPADVRMKCYTTLIDKYYVKERVALSVYPQAMRYAGPREAVLHALVRQNYGCTHIIVGRDHAGVGDYYGTYDAQDMFDKFDSTEIAITPLKYEHAFWCKLTGAMASGKTSPATGEDKVFLSGTKVREMLTNGERPPVEFSRPEVADILIDSYASKVEA